MEHTKELNRIKNDPVVREQFLRLFRSILQQEPCTEEQTDWHWEEIFALARSHQIFPLIFEAASEVPEFAASPLFQTHLVEAMSQVSAQASRTEALLELYRAFDQAGIHPLVVKGIVCRQLYGDYADHRPSGDEDILVRKEDYETARKVLEQLGYCIQDMDDSEDGLNEIKDVTFVNDSISMTIELHLNLLGTYTSLHKKMSQFFENSFERRRTVMVQQVALFTLNHTDHFVYLFYHALKHVIEGGLGIRQMADILLYERMFQDEIDWNTVGSAMKEVNATRFYADVHQFGNTWLGFDLPVRWQVTCPDALLDDMMNSGAFGIDRQSNRLAGHMLQTTFNDEAEHTNNRFILALRAAFPSKDYMIARNPILKEHPELIWHERMDRLKKCFHMLRKSDENVLLETMKTSQERIELLKKYDIL